MSVGALATPAALGVVSNSRLDQVSAQRRKKKRKKGNKGNNGSSSGSGGGNSTSGNPRPGSALAIYDVAVQGVVNGLGFSRTGVVILRQPFSSAGTQNGAKPVDVCFATGNPWTSRSVGVMYLGSNSACFGGTAQIDMATVSRPTATQILVLPDGNVAATCTNVYNRSSGVTAAVYAPYNGGMLLELGSQGQVIAGAIDTNGLGNCIAPVGSRYQAQVSGQWR